MLAPRPISLWEATAVLAAEAGFLIAAEGNVPVVIHAAADRERSGSDLACDLNRLTALIDREQNGFEHAFLHIIHTDNAGLAPDPHDSG